MTSIILLSVFGIINLFLGFLRSNKFLLPVAMLILVVVFGANAYDWSQETQSFFSNMLIIDRYAVVFTGIMVLTALLLLPFSEKYVRDGEENLAEYYSLLLFSLVGAIMMVSYNNMLMLFIGIEILSISMYVVAGANKRDARSNEAALKYFLMGAFATGILLFGVALLYGATGTFYLSQLADAIASPANASLQPMLYVGILLIIIGISFKVGAAPFHFWTPDVYEGTPTFFTAFMSTVVKTAGFAAFLKLLLVGFGGAQAFWFPTVMAITVLTLLIGNLGAAVQLNAKRMLAYSSISHAGYLFIGLVALDGKLSTTGIFFYSLAYSVATISAFAVLKLVEDQRQRTDYDALNGLARTNPLLAGCMGLAMLSLAGIPLTGGFFGKFFIFSAAIDKGHVWLVVFALVMSMVGIYYYLRPVIAMYLKPAEEDFTAPVLVSRFQSFMLVVLAVLTVLLGVLPGLFTDLL